MNYLFDKATNKLVAFSENDLSDQQSESYFLHVGSVSIDQTDFAGYSLIDGEIIYEETQDHKDMIASKEKAKTNEELLIMIEQLQARLDSLGS